MSASATENSPLISNEQGIIQAVATEKQKKQVRYLYLVHFLSTISISIVSTLLLIFIEVAQIRDETINIVTNNLPYLKFATLILSSIPLGLLADKIGRKKVLNACLLGSALSIYLFGYCKTINFATYLSFLIGAFSCSYIAVKTIIVESSIKSHRAYYLSRLIIITGVANGIGYFIGFPFVIFLISTPVTELPYKIPCSIASIISIIAFIFSHFCLDETLGSKINQVANNSTSLSVQQHNNLPRSELVTELGLTITKDSDFIINGFCIVTIIFSGFTSVALNWAMDEVDNGGLNLNLEHVIMTIGAISLISTLSILLSYPSLHRKYGSFKLYKVIFLPTAAIFIISSILRLFAKTGDYSTVLTLFAAIFSTLAIFHIIQEISLDLLLIDSSKLTNNLATLFGISNVIVNTLNCPSLFNFIFYISTDGALPFPLKFNIYWVLLALISYIGYRYSRKRDLN